MNSRVGLPDDHLARQLAYQTFGIHPIEVSRFPAGLMHYVFEAKFDSHAPVVIRIAASYGRTAMKGAARLSRILRPRQVPLPAILAEDLDATFPYLILERLPGSDLGDVIENLSQDRLEAIAGALVVAQRATAGLGNPYRKYGYAVLPEDAPYLSWSQVLASHLERSQKRISEAGLFDVRETARLSTILKEMECEMEGVTSTPFLHDTTTKNVIVSAVNGGLSGIVDVDDLCFGDPRYVVALTHAALLKQNVAVHYTETWMRLAGFSADRLFNFYVALFLADFMAERGQRFNGNAPPSNPDFDQFIRGLYLGVLSLL
jgi:hypothetical protein